jgi:hypothetical protein
MEESKMGIRHWLLFGVVIATGATSHPWMRAPDEEMLTTSEKQDLMLILEAKESAITRDAYARVLRKLSPERLRTLKAHSNTGIALSAAWEVTQRGIRSRGKVNPADMERFLGFCEGRLQSRIDKTWDETLLSAMVGVDGRIAFPKEPTVELRQCLKYDFSHSRQLGVELQNDHVVFTTSRDSVRLSTLVLDSILYRARNGVGRRIEMVANEDRAYFAIHSACASPYSIVCVERRSGDVLWQSDVWASGGLYAYEGRCWQWVDLKAGDGSVTVMGVAQDVAYVEAFSGDDGSNLFRFNTTLLWRR